MVDLEALHEPIEPQLRDAVDRVVRSGRYAFGPELEAFEREWAAYCGTAHAVGVQSGTSALVAALAAVGIGPGDEVVTATNTFVATVGAIHFVGATPVLVDVEPETSVLSPDGVSRVLGDRTRAVVAVHLYGRVADVSGIRERLEGTDAVVIEDASQAHGASLKGQRAGSLAKVGCFSFYPSKNLGALGEAGAVTTDDDVVAQRVRRFRNHGGVTRYEHEQPGLNLRLPEIQAAALRVKLPHLDRWNRRRREIAERYRLGLSDLPLTLPVPAGEEHVYHLFVVEADDRDALARHLASREIRTGVHYPRPVHGLPAYRSLGYEWGTFPVAEGAAERILSLPIFPTLTDADVDRVVEEVRSFYQRP